MLMNSLSGSDEDENRQNKIMKIVTSTIEIVDFGKDFSYAAYAPHASREMMMLAWVSALWRLLFIFTKT